MLIEKNEYERLLTTVHKYTDHLPADRYRFITDHDTLTFFIGKVEEEFPQLTGQWMGEVITTTGAIFAFVAGSRENEIVHLPNLGDFSSFDEFMNYVNENSTSGSN